jgi:hypothetical protein
MVNTPLGNSVTAAQLPLQSAAEFILQTGTALMLSSPSADQRV